MARFGKAVEMACPFIDANDGRCSPRFSLRHLQQAFHVCANGGHECCSVYHQLLREQQRRETNRLTISITVEGRQPTHLPAIAGRVRDDADRTDAPLRFPGRGDERRGRGDVALRAVGS